MAKIAICTIMKQEEPYILEWVAYHRKLGFDLVIADNGGNDRTTDLLSALDRAGLIKRLDFRWCRSRPQLPAYRALLRLTCPPKQYQLESERLRVNMNFVPTSKDRFARRREPEATGAEQSGRRTPSG